MRMDTFTDLGNDLVETNVKHSSPHFNLSRQLWHLEVGLLPVNAEMGIDSGA